jgi:hypothetical protein
MKGCNINLVNLESTPHPISRCSHLPRLGNLLVTTNVK